MSKKCLHCDEPFVPREAKARFCCAECRIEYYANERREAVKRFREEMRQPS